MTPPRAPGGVAQTLQIPGEEKALDMVRKSPRGLEAVVEYFRNSPVYVSDGPSPMRVESMGEVRVDYIRMKRAALE